MPPEIRASTPDDLPDLGRFLLDGFHAPEDSAFASAEVLRWKYFEPMGGDAGNLPGATWLAKKGPGGSSGTWASVRADCEGSGCLPRASRPFT